MRTRVVTALILIPVVLAIICNPSIWPLYLLVVLLGFLGYRELANLYSKPSHVVPLLGLVLLLGSLPFLTVNIEQTTALVLLLVLTLVGIITASYASRKPSEAGTLQLEVSSLWIFCPLVGLFMLSQIGHDNIWSWQRPLLMVLLPLWAGDTAAIFAGKYFGKHLLAPTLSPKKTWEGGIANFVLCVSVSTGLGYLLKYPLWVSASIGLLLGVLGQTGDLFQSYLKRKAGVKDSGAILPGHGGILDRIDSLLFVALPIAIILSLILD